MTAGEMAALLAKVAPETEVGVDVDSVLRDVDRLEEEECTDDGGTTRRVVVYFR